MLLSESISRLRRRAKLLAQREQIPLHKALDRVAKQEGYTAWSLLVSKAHLTVPASQFFDHLKEGDFVLVGSPAGQGKTLMGIRLAIEAMKRGRLSKFFSLVFSNKDVASCFDRLGASEAQFAHLFEFDGSDGIEAAYIARKLAEAPRGTLAVVDYMQLLDQKRGNADLMSQVQSLATLARDTGVILILLSQIDRAYDPSTKPCPDLADVRMPNPVDLSLFTKTCFLNRGQVQFEAAG